MPTLGSVFKKTVYNSCNPRIKTHQTRNRLIYKLIDLIISGTSPTVPNTRMEDSYTLFDSEQHMPLCSVVTWTVLAPFSISWSFPVLSIPWTQQFTLHSVMIVHLQPLHILTRPPPRHFQYLFQRKIIQQACMRKRYFSFLRPLIFPTGTPFRFNRVQLLSSLSKISLQPILLYCKYQKCFDSNSPAMCKYCTCPWLLFLFSLVPTIHNFNGLFSFLFEPSALVLNSQSDMTK